jgi:hypothetical protein
MALFSLGKIVATPGALDALARASQELAEFLTRHVRGDWGNLSANDLKDNELALSEGNRILSAYWTNLAEKIWIITEADRSSTCIMLPEEY